MDQAIDIAITASQALVLLVLLYVVAKLNRAVKILNNRVNILSQIQRQIGEERHDPEPMRAEDDRLRASLERDFREGSGRKRRKDLSGTQVGGWRGGTQEPDPTR